MCVFLNNKEVWLSQLTLCSHHSRVVIMCPSCQSVDQVSLVGLALNSWMGFGL